MEITPQECSFGSLGTKLAVPKRVVPPEVLPAVALPPAVTPVGNAMTPFSPVEAASDPPSLCPWDFRLQWLQLRLHQMFL